ncbi:MAG: fructose-6-phosphate aldolase [Spirochaetes bacterium]|jgi:transaldolase|nr:fructose-6-phosphate aldolase [Spirochaetota bacterium]NLJ05326.1 fructose-6-phosphate aldolase [Exilispira sp.]MBP8991300.1 fructose-6-phosphate aldolase [Spirochaetota bacterium]HOV45986.1 fructose-6-phosphate aldolase [Exilispira sp.]HPO60299.1 fructose-6-phosphate aldolase [Exilispira sp.]
MKFFLDTANIDEIAKGLELGIIDGVTTNPTLVSKEKAPFEERIKQICELVKGPVSAEVISIDAVGMVEEARKLAKISQYVVIKIPMTEEGIKAVKRLKDEGIRTNVTLIFSPLQALVAAKAGASYVSPFVGRLDDIGHDGMELVSDIKTIFINYGFETNIIVASIRHPQHILTAAKIGADIATIPFSVLTRIMKHPLTDAGIQTFMRDWQDYKEKLNNR